MSGERAKKTVANYIPIEQEISSSEKRKIEKR